MEMQTLSMGMSGDFENAIRQAKICVENDLCGTMQAALDELKPSQSV